MNWVRRRDEKGLETIGFLIAGFFIIILMLNIYENARFLITQAKVQGLAEEFAVSAANDGLTKDWDSWARTEGRRRCGSACTVAQASSGSPYIFGGNTYVTVRWIYVPAIKRLPVVGNLVLAPSASSRAVRVNYTSSIGNEYLW